MGAVWVVLDGMEWETLLLTFGSVPAVDHGRHGCVPIEDSVRLRTSRHGMMRSGDHGYCHCCRSARCPDVHRAVRLLRAKTPTRQDGGR